MAHQAFAAYGQQQNRGTLPPGHTIVVNKYTVQVERYLSQGGFAHVYVVRTANPINNTTQHVLKRIAVADEAMLGEVKKEVDIMRFLRGHPNIVNLIDASWNKLPNGTYEVFILMELCAGGGIIDMMNRRLRERLTEAEILQIFVDVCEAVAAMHNLKPPLLHRDLKVENILQSSLTRYKLCDFGSSTPVAPRPPSSTQEIRALEADLNRHTTLQYRAPEMVDVYLRRPVDEKSDVWALGVLLYKLCYYTTPFEEHGPLAILNVQYRIPPYPVYSAQMNSLIGSMLRELGAQRPSVFEILNIVHQMRGSKSPYRYNIPAQQSLRPLPQKPPRSELDDIVAIRPSPATNVNPNAAAQARQTVLNAIAPMRRGRPTATSISGPSSITGQEKETGIPKLREQWDSAKVEDNDDPWAIGGNKVKDKGKFSPGEGFDGFGDSFAGSTLEKPMSPPAPSPSPAAPKLRPTGMLDVKKDAFDGLGISRSREPSPTLGEVSDRKSRFGINESARPPALSAVSRTPVPSSAAAPLSPRIPASRTGLATYRSPVSLTVEERFPSLDDLDKEWRSQSTHPPAPSQPEPPNRSSPLPQKPAGTSQPSLTNATSGPRTLEPKPFTAPSRGEARSQQVTGTAMRSGQAEVASVAQPSLPIRPSSSLDPADKRHMPIGSSPTKYRPSRPALARKHRSSMSIKYTEPRSPPPDWLTGADPVKATSPLETSPSPVRRRASPNLLTATREPDNGNQGITSNVSYNGATRYKQDMKHVQQDISSSASSEQREDAVSKVRLKQEPKDSKPVPQRQDSSSDEAEGPEDVNNRVISDDIRNKRAKGRQSSVHDLVDLYGGAARTSVERERTGPPSPVVGRKGRRTSGILVDLSLPSQAPSQPTLLSPATIIPESRAELADRRTGFGSQEERTSSPTSLLDSYERTSRPPSRTSPVPPTTDRTERSRPQSMFMFPAPKPLDPPTNVGASPGMRSRHSPRRGSISDMVDLYENLGGGSRLKDPPPIASKPAGLKFNKTPSPIASRFPAVSPTGMSFPITQATSVFAELPKGKPKPRRSPTTDSFNGRISPGHSMMQNDRNDFISRVPRRRSISPAKTTPAPVKLTPISAVSSPSKPVKPPISIPIAGNIASGQRTPVTEASISSPSPERPYQGVGKLIDQWQKKTEEADTSRQSGPRSTGRPLGPRPVGRAR